MENRAHSESREKRLKRFENGPPMEVIETLLNSISNYFNNEIDLTIKQDSPQTSLLFLGIHAVALTISEAFFDKKGQVGYKLFLENFIDGDTRDTKFSEIADLIHGWRNIIAHQWISSTGHEIGYDYNMTFGWQRRNGVVFINPRIYCEYYLKAFSSGGKIWEYGEIFNNGQLEKIKRRMIDKYIKK